MSGEQCAAPRAPFGIRQSRCRTCRTNFSMFDHRFAAILAKFGPCLQWFIASTTGSVGRWQDAQLGLHDSDMLFPGTISLFLGLPPAQGYTDQVDGQHDLGEEEVEEDIQQRKISELTLLPGPRLSPTAQGYSATPVIYQHKNGLNDEKEYTDIDQSIQPVTRIFRSSSSNTARQDNGYHHEQ